MNIRRSIRLGSLVALLWCGAVFAAPDGAGSPPAATPGADSALRRSIDEVRAGTPDYEQMSQGFGDAVRQQLPQVQALFKTWGAIQSMTFTGKDPSGADTYEVEFEHGAAQFLIALSPDGKIAGELFRAAGAQAGPPAAPADAPPAQPGPYAVTAEPAFGAPGLRTYRPASLESFPRHDTMPVVVWGNGGCNMDVPDYGGFLTTIASHGFLVVTTAGTMQQGTPARQATADDLKAAIDWADRENTRAGSPLSGKIAAKRVAVMGQSCGGGLALTLGADPRVSTIGVFNFGVQVPDGKAPTAPLPTLDVLKPLHGPVLLINGGKPDFMMGPSKATYEAIATLPVFYGSRHDVGHAATMFYPGGGEFANVASNWVLWQFKHDSVARAMFIGTPCALCKNTTWDTESKHLAK